MCVKAIDHTFSHGPTFFFFFFFFFLRQSFTPLRLKKKKKKKSGDKNDCNPQTEVEHNACREVASVQLKYLGTVVDSKLSFSDNVVYVYKREEKKKKKKKKKKRRAALVLV